MDAAAIERQNKINVDGVFATIRAAAKVLPDHGRIIIIGSGAGTRTGFGGAADYSACPGQLRSKGSPAWATNSLKGWPHNE